MVYVNDPHGFSVEILRTKPGLADRIFGFEPRPLHKRPDPDTRRIEHRIKINAPADKVWDAITDQDNMARWIGFDPGHGAQGRLDTAPRRRFRTPDARPARSRPGRGASDSHQPAESLRYRVIEGSPLTCHQGEITLKHSGGHTELHWSIRFRPKVAGTGALLQKVLQAKLRTMLAEYLKPYIEKSTAPGVFTTPNSTNTETAVR